MIQEHKDHKKIRRRLHLRGKGIFRKVYHLVNKMVKKISLQEDKYLLMNSQSNVRNTKAYFNRSYIPQLIVEEEDQFTKDQRELRDREEKKERRGILDQEDSTWEEKQSKDRELCTKKRRRGTEREGEGRADDQADVVRGRRS